MKNNIQHIVDHFFEEGKFTKIDPIEQGLINDTYLIGSEHINEKYILQKINKHVFREPRKVMHNFSAILDHLSNKEPDGYAYLSLKKTHEGDNFYRDNNKDYWRVFKYFDDTVTFDQAVDGTIAYEASRAFGNFLKNLHDLGPDQLYETIPLFHDYKNRVTLLEQAERKDIKDRSASVGSELDDIKNRLDYIKTFYQLEFPERVIHGDTKINNVLFNRQNRKATCVIDLDLAMPGPLLYDYGDMVRSYTNTTLEDDPELSRVGVNLDIFKALTTGFLSESSHILSPEESENLLLGARVVILVQVIRYITDYLSGDPYYKIKHEHHNLDRTRNQLRLLKSIEELSGDMNRIIRSFKP